MNNKQDAQRTFVIRALFFGIGALLLWKLADLQLFDDSYKARAGATAREKITIYPSRGLIYDRNGKLLINNEPVFDLMVTYNQVNPQMDTTKFCALLGITKAEFVERIEKDFKRDIRFSKRKPFTFLTKISPETFAQFQESLYEFPGFFIQVRNVRGYPQPNAAHVLGYIREVNPAEVKESPDIYISGDYIGASGLELAYEEALRGGKGAEYVLKDNFGRIVGPYQKGALDSLPISGKDIITGLDIELQAYGEWLMQNKTGSIVAIEPQTGEILTMISMPTYDPNLLTINRDRGNAYKELLTNPLLPFFDRAVMAEYPPGSIFKTVVALVALQEGVIQHETGFGCARGYYYNGRTYKCHSHPYASNVSLATAHSCNAYFWQTFRRIIDKFGFYEPQKGLALFDKYCAQFGLDKPLGLDFPREKSGNIPTPEYYDKRIKGWKSPTIMSVGIGQGEIQMTTVQIANLAAALANRGTYITPHLRRQYKGGQPEKYPSHKIDIDRQHFEWVVAGMEGAVSSGTARKAFLPGISICGKTGTVQNPQGEDHSAFFAFAPRDNPKIAIAVFVENAGWGGSYAAPIASLMIEKYINGSISEPRKRLETQMIEANLVNDRLIAAGYLVRNPNAPNPAKIIKEEVPEEVVDTEGTPSDTLIPKVGQ